VKARIIENTEAYLKMSINPQYLAAPPAMLVTRIQGMRTRLNEVAWRAGGSQ
jgi:hypothetical protein